MRKVLLIISFAFIMSNVFSINKKRDGEFFNAQSEVSVSGSKPIYGSRIKGVVKYEYIPLVDRGDESDKDVSNNKDLNFVDCYMAFVFEKNALNEVVAQTKTDIDGRFSLNVVDPSDSLEIFYSGYLGLKIPINGTNYKFFLVRDPNINTNESHIKPVERFAYPLLVLDKHSQETDSTYWKDIDPNKESYSKDELATLFGINPDEIKQTWIYRGEDAIELYGDRGKSGVFIIETINGNMGGLFQERLEREIGKAKLRRGTIH